MCVVGGIVSLILSVNHVFLFCIKLVTHNQLYIQIHSKYLHLNVIPYTRMHFFAKAYFMLQ